MEAEDIVKNVDGLKLESDLIDTEEYKNLFESAKKQYPNEYEYLLQIACISHLSEMKLKDKNLL